MYIDNVCYVHVVIFRTVTTSEGTAVICCRVTAPKFIRKKKKEKKKEKVVRYKVQVPSGGHN